MKFVHLAVDDKFIDFFYETCERVYPGENMFLVIGKKGALRYVKRGDLVRCVDQKFLRTKEMHDVLADCRVLIVHYLTIDGIRLICRAPKDVIVFWSGWGGDYYERMHCFEEWAFGERTRNVLGQIKSLKDSLSLVQSIRLRIHNWRMMLQERKAISRADYFSAPIPEDYELVKAAFPEFHAKYLQLNYGSVEKTFRLGPQSVSGNNILVGNSADPTNNHLEVFDILRSIDLGESLVFAPLSYGDPNYRDHVISEGKKLLGDCFRPMVDFMSLEDYNHTIASCRTVIMNHRRQQAMGNIGTMLYKGAKVFLNGKGVTFDFFVKRGAHVFDVETISTFGKGIILQPLTESQVADNRKILESFWRQDIVEENIRKLGQVLNDAARP